MKHMRTFISAWASPKKPCYWAALNFQRVQLTCSWTAFYPSPPSCLNIYHHNCQIHVGQVVMHLRTVSGPDKHQRCFSQPFLAPWKDPRDPHLDQSILDDPAHVQPPLCHVRVVVIQVGREGQQMRSEILCKLREKRIQYFTCILLPCTQSLAPRLKDNSSLLHSDARFPLKVIAVKSETWQHWWKPF